MDDLGFEYGEEMVYSFRMIGFFIRDSMVESIEIFCEDLFKLFESI